jgi:hypothetical protein
MNLAFLEYSHRISKRPHSCRNIPTVLELTPGFIDKKTTFMEIISSFWKSLQVLGIMADSTNSLNKVMDLLFSLNSRFSAYTGRFVEISTAF